ncbi:MAG: hypothetical protein ACI9MB_002211, partial [Verrucomicrobiales bacterium]
MLLSGYALTRSRKKCQTVATFLFRKASEASVRPFGNDRR